jgi:hypothetical protein
VSDKSSPATSQPSGRTSRQSGPGHPAEGSPAAGDSDEALSALQAVQEAMDRRDNGGAADRPVPADSAGERSAS